MAAQVIDVVLEQLRRPARPTTTTHAVLPGGDIASFDRLVGDIARATGDVDLAAHLASAYGSRWPDVWRDISSDGRERLDAALPYTIGEMRYGVRDEMAMTIGD